jgi:DTW domain-containing protein YfiP
LARGPVDFSRRCPRCAFPPEACICDAVPRLETRTRFLVLRHASELARPTNSARWAALAIPTLRIVDYALPGEPLDVAALVAAQEDALIADGHGDEDVSALARIPRRRRA